MKRMPMSNLISPAGTRDIPREKQAQNLLCDVLLSFNKSASRYYWLVNHDQETMSSLMGITSDQYMRVMEVCGFYNSASPKKKWRKSPLLQWLNANSIQTFLYAHKGLEGKRIFLGIGNGCHPTNLNPKEQYDLHLEATHTNRRRPAISPVDKENIVALLSLCNEQDDSNKENVEVTTNKTTGSFN